MDASFLSNLSPLPRIVPRETDAFKFEMSQDGIQIFKATPAGLVGCGVGHLAVRLNLFCVWRQQ